jgi:osmoprotectant transport system ATP-binding protein
MIELLHVTKEYNNIKVVDDVSLKINSGETLVLLGTSGSGKTTTLKMINRLIEPDAGAIKINGENIKNQPLTELRRNIGYVIQQIGLFPHMTVKDNVAVILKLLKWDKTKINSRVALLLNITGLPVEEVWHKYPAQLSGGQMQRVGIARALAADPPIVLMDEPFGALDPITRANVQQEFKNLEQSIKKTIIIVTHDVVEAITLADKICLMDQGKIQQVGTPADLIFKPANPFVKKFFSAHRLQIELMATRLKDLEFTQDQYPDDINLYELLNNLEENSIDDQAVSLPAVFKAFYEFKIKQSHGN